MSDRCDIADRIGALAVRNAVTAARQWEFVPAILNGSSITTTVEIDLTFTLR